DANFFENRLSTTFEYYTEKRWGILIQDGTAPGFLGFSVPYANNGKVNSWGWELSLKWNDKIKENFRYWANFNLSYNQNKVIERKEAPQDNAYQYLKGHRIGSRSQYVFFRYYDSETPELYEKKFNRPYPEQIVADLKDGDAVYVDLNGDRVIDSNDMSYDYGYTNDPRYMAGLTLGFSWKNWEFSMQWTGAWKVSRAISDVYQRPFVSSSGQTDGGLVKYHLNNTWTAENPSQKSKYPRATWDNASQNYATSTLYEQDSKYLRLKTVQIAYNFNAPFMKKVGLSDLQLALSGYNILTFSPYIWGDPEAVASNAPAYPLTKTYSISLKVGF
ncbi:MAG: SusC/RagA family TonB-linked outer membrane protein, partial [Prevotellaceae bacterium]|nr:SusC/RagA family TonB-linked outer membrane protein [Prevotellaceae bacterium]